jgi:LacI family transcriptional regulator
MSNSRFATGSNGRLYLAVASTWINAPGLPKLCGIVCANDGLGVRMVVASQDNGHRVPDDIGVIGVGDDEMQCVQSPVPLTSVSRDLEAVGLGAAEYLDLWMRRDDVDASPIRCPVGEVVARQSTLVFGESDPIVRRALTLIHAPDARPMTVELLLDLLGDVSRRRLESLFRQRLNRTPYQEILRARIQHAKRLLISTSLSIDEIAFRSGFSSSIHFSRPFKAPPA